MSSDICLLVVCLFIYLFPNTDVIRRYYSISFAVFAFLSVTQINVIIPSSSADPFYETRCTLWVYTVYTVELIMYYHYIQLRAP